jgi:hypothetical protein
MIKASGDTAAAVAMAVVDKLEEVSTFCYAMTTTHDWRMRAHLR